MRKTSLARLSGRLGLVVGVVGIILAAPSRGFSKAPPETLPLGGYNAWPARTAGLQADAETIIADTLLSMFEELSGKKRKEIDLSNAPYAKMVLERMPLAYWRLGEIDGTAAEDISGHGNHGRLETGYLFYLDGPQRDDLRAGDEREGVLTGGPPIEPKTWNHVRLVRQGDQVRVYLNFQQEPIISGRAGVTRPEGCSHVFLAGRSDNFANFEGRIADAAIYATDSK